MGVGNSNTRQTKIDGGNMPTNTSQIIMYFDNGAPNNVGKFCEKICKSNQKRYNCTNTTDDDGCKGYGWDHHLVDNFKGCKSYDIVKGGGYNYNDYGEAILCEVTQYGTRKD